MPASCHLHRRQISLGGSSWRQVTWPDQEAKKAFPMSPSCPAMDTCLLQKPRKWSGRQNGKGRCKWDSIWELSDSTGIKVHAECNSLPPPQSPTNIGEMGPNHHITCLCTRQCCLKRHLCKIKIETSLSCASALDETPHYVLQFCPLYDKIRKQTWPCTISKETKLHG